MRASTHPHQPILSHPFTHNQSLPPRQTSHCRCIATAIVINSRPVHSHFTDCSQVKRSSRASKVPAKFFTTATRATQQHVAKNASISKSTSLFATKTSRELISRQRNATSTRRWLPCPACTYTFPTLTVGHHHEDIAGDPHCCSGLLRHCKRILAHAMSLADRRCAPRPHRGSRRHQRPCTYHYRRWR